MVKMFRPETLAEALALRRAQECIPFSGGTDLMARYRAWTGVEPNFQLPILLLGHLAELRTLRVQDGKLVIGAACTLTFLLESDLLPAGMKTPIAEMASPAIRNVATLGGNVGNASPAGDTLPMLIALDAEVSLQSSGAHRRIPVSDFLAGPGRTTLAPDELISDLRVPLPGKEAHCWYRKLGTRRANCLSKASLFGWSAVRDGRLDRVGFAFGAVAPVIVRCRQAERMLEGLAPEQVPACKSDLAAMLDRMLQPIDDQRSTAEYRRDASMGLLDEFLSDLAESGSL